MSHYDVSGGCQLLYHLEQAHPGDDEEHWDAMCVRARAHIAALERAMRYRGVGRPKATHDEEGVCAAVDERLEAGMKKTPAYREVGALFKMHQDTVKKIYSRQINLDDR